MAEEVKLNISGNMSKLKGQLAKTDKDIQKRSQKIDQLKAKIKQTEAKMAAMKAQVGGLAKGVGVGLGTAAITLAIQDTFTSTGMEGAQWAGGLTAVAAGGAFGGPAGAVTAALAVGISELTKWVGELSQKVMALDQKAEMQYKQTEVLEKMADENRRALHKQLNEQVKQLREMADKKANAMGNNIARMMTLRGAE